jgi:NADH-quinone oxidoreductase subunit B
VVTTNLEKLLGWAASNSMFPLTFGLACCAIEMIAAVGSPRNDQARFGAEALRASPRQADFIILSGRVSIKMAPVIRRLYDQMLEPRWAISMGACSSSGGMFANYAVVQGADKFMPIDIHVPGCPPRPEALFYGFNKLQRMIQGHPDQGWRRRYNAIGTEEWARDDVIAGQPSEASEAAYARARQAVTRAAESTGPEGPGSPPLRGAGIR